jgi:hypothetical protein
LRGAVCRKKRRELMGKVRLGLLLLFVLLIVGACVIGRPTPEQLAVADCGPYPDDWETIVKGYYWSVLFDPYSAVYQFAGPPRPGWMTQEGSGWWGIFYGTPVYGWQVSGTVNAKNRSGSEAGPRAFTVLIRGGQVVKATGPCREPWAYGSELLGWFVSGRSPC